MAELPSTPERPTFLSVPLDALTIEETVARCRELILAHRPVQHVVLNAGKCVLMEDEPDLRAIISGCDLVSADGQGVVWAGRLLGIRIPERVTGIDLMGRLLGLAASEGWPVYLLGARDDVLADFAVEAKRRYPALVLAGHRNGYFTRTEEGLIADAVRTSGARLLFVAISSPLKEQFLARQLHRMGPIFAMGVGGSFDVWAGRTTRAPRWMQKSGLEWFHRFAQEPRRMWRRYLLGNMRFAWMVAKARMRADRTVG